MKRSLLSLCLLVQVLTITVIPLGMSGGATWYLPKEEREECLVQ